MDELVERVRLALAGEYPGAPNGRVRDLPDRRAIRWYTTTGLVDRPAGMRGRTALYQRRHLLQLVALKRRQAQGRTLAQIQAELAGASDEALADVARVPDGLLVWDGLAPDPETSPVRTRFWAATPGIEVPAGVAASEAAGTASPSAPTAIEEPRSKPRLDTAHPDPDLSFQVEGTAVHRGATPIGGVDLGGGAILVLPRPPAPGDYAAIAAAAAPLLDLLVHRGLLTTAGRTS